MAVPVGIPARTSFANGIASTSQILAWKAKNKKSHDFMLGLMADDIENTVGYNKKAPREPDEMLLRKELCDAIAVRFHQFFGTPNPTAEDMYTCRGQMAAE
eukprot:11643221-Heterocapsa_arctica.AAC.1